LRVTARIENFPGLLTAGSGAGDTLADNHLNVRLVRLSHPLKADTAAARWAREE